MEFLIFAIFFLGRIRHVIDYGGDTSGFPVSLLLIDEEKHPATEVIGHIRMTQVLNVEKAVYLETRKCNL